MENDNVANATMASQADGLRQMLAKHIIPVVGSKRGIGRSSFIWNLATALSSTFARLLIYHVAPDHLPDIYAERTIRRNLKPLETVWRQREELSAAIAVARRPNISVAQLGDIHGEYTPVDGKLPEKDLRERVGMETQRIEDMYDCILVDVGTASHTQSIAVLLELRRFFMVITPDIPARTSGYALIKHLTALGAECDISLIVNMGTDEDQARRVADSLITTCSDFLGINVSYLDFIPMDFSIMNAQWKSQSVVEMNNPSAAAQSILRIAATLGQMIAERELPHASLGAMILTAALTEESE